MAVVVVTITKGTFLSGGMLDLFTVYPEGSTSSPSSRSESPFTRSRLHVLLRAMTTVYSSIAKGLGQVGKTLRRENRVRLGPPHRVGKF
jgi:hypothetical protein